MKIIHYADGTTEQITDQQEIAINQAITKGAKHFLLSGHLIAFASIMKITDAPSEAPKVKLLPEPEYKATRGREQLLKGLRKSGNIHLLKTLESKI